jgi:cyanophycinase
MALDSAQASDEELLAPVDSADVLYFTGGNPRYLLSVLQESLLLQKLRNALTRGAIVAGSSAGAMVLGSWMWFHDWVEALSIVEGVAVLPHHERSNCSTVTKRLETRTSSNVAVLGIDAMACCIRSREGWRVLGQGAVTLYLNGGWQKFESGQAIPIPITERFGYAK